MWLLFQKNALGFATCIRTWIFWPLSYTSCFLNNWIKSSPLPSQFHSFVAKRIGHSLMWLLVVFAEECETIIKKKYVLDYKCKLLLPCCWKSWTEYIVTKIRCALKLGFLVFAYSVMGQANFCIFGFFKKSNPDRTFIWPWTKAGHSRSTPLRFALWGLNCLGMQPWTSQVSRRPLHRSARVLNCRGFQQNRSRGWWRRGASTVHWQNFTLVLTHTLSTSSILSSPCSLRDWTPLIRVKRGRFT